MAPDTSQATAKAVRTLNQATLSGLMIVATPDSALGLDLLMTTHNVILRPRATSYTRHPPTAAVLPALLHVAVAISLFSLFLSEYWVVQVQDVSTCHHKLTQTPILLIVNTL